MKIKPFGTWVREGKHLYLFRAHDGSVHARVQFSIPVVDERTPWVGYTFHTEGNQRFDTPTKAKRYCERRLRDLLTAIEPLRKQAV